MKTHLKLILAGGLIAASFATVHTARATSGTVLENSLPGGSSARGIVSTAVRHLLNFRNETPLNSEQKEAIAKIIQSHRDEILGQFHKAVEARRGMATAASAQGADSSAAKEAAEKIGAAARDRALLIARIASEVRPHLTPDQVARVQSARAEIEGLIDRAFAGLPN